VTPNAWPPYPYWVPPARPSLLRRLGFRHPAWVYAAVGSAAFAATTLAAWAAIWISNQAYVDCGVDLDAGGRFAITFEMLFIAPAFGCLACAASLLVSRVHPLLGLAIAFAVAVAAGYWFLGEAPPTIRLESHYGPCPRGIPPWWPWWAPR
jgi:hypothetical protein